MLIEFSVACKIKFKKTLKRLCKKYLKITKNSNLKRKCNIASHEPINTSTGDSVRIKTVQTGQQLGFVQFFSVAFNTIRYENKAVLTH